MPTPPDSLPDDASALKALLVAAQAENERLIAIIKELQRYRFGPRSEKIDPGPLALMLEDVEQAIAASAAQAESQTEDQPAKTPVQRKRQVNRGALPKHLPRRGRRRRYRRQELPMLQRPSRQNRRGCLGTARHDPGALQGDRDASAQIRLPRLRGRDGPSSCARASDRGWHSNGKFDRGGRHCQIRRPSAALSAGPDLWPPGRRTRSLDAGRLVGPRRLRAASRARTPAPSLEGLGQTLRRRDAGAGARSGPTQNQDWPALGLRPRRPALGRSGAARRCLCLRARPQT